MNIRAILHYDLYSEPSDVEVIDGGVGENFVILRIESQPGQGINSFIQIYGDIVE